MTVRFEACVETLAQAIAAQESGADRIELCACLDAGGTTPDAADLMAVRQALRIPVQVMVRPRAGDFVYTARELDVMRAAIDAVHRVAAAGVVFGVLRADHTLDLTAMAALARHARPLSLTCHRAFDQTPDLPTALDQLIELGFDRVLTSGGHATAWEGRSVLRGLVTQARGRVTVLAGGGIREHNWRELVAATGIQEIHAAALIRTR
jgi:copper homeostasis protein